MNIRFENIKDVGPIEKALLNREKAVCISRVALIAQGLKDGDSTNSTSESQTQEGIAVDDIIIQAANILEKEFGWSA